MILSIDYNGSMLILSFPIRAILVAFSFPFALSSTFVVGFYWLEIFSKKKLVASIGRLKKYAIHFAVVLFIIFSMELITCIMRILLIDANIIIGITILVYLTSNVFTCGFFIYACFILKRSIYHSKTSTTTNRLLKLGIVKCVILAIFVIFISICLIPELAKPLSSMLQVPILHFLMTLYCFLQAIMFKLPKSAGSEPSSAHVDFSKISSEFRNESVGGTLRGVTVPKGS